MPETATCPHCSHGCEFPPGTPEEGRACPNCGAALPAPGLRVPNLARDVSLPTPGRSFLKLLGGMAVLGAGILLLVYGAGQIGLDGLFRDEGGRVAVTVKQGMEKKEGMEFRKVSLTARGDGTWTGTAADAKGRTWDLVKVWREGNSIRWVYHQPREVIEAAFREEVADQIGDPVRSVKLERGADGKYTGRIETASGVVCTIVETPTPDGNTQIGWKIDPSGYPAWVKIEAAATHDVALKTVRLAKHNDGEWRGEGSTANGEVYRLQLLIEDNPGQPGQILRLNVEPKAGAK